MNFQTSLFQKGVPIVVLAICISCLATLGFREYFIQQDAKQAKSAVINTQEPIQVNDAEGEAVKLDDTVIDEK